MEKGHRRGFTLVEVMIVMLLFSMLLLMIFPMRRMAVWVLDHARTQEQAEMLGDAAWRYVADRLETGAVEVEELDGLSMDAFHIDTLKPEIEVEESRSGRVLVTVRVMDGKKDLYERNGSVQTGDGAGYNPRQPRIRSTDSNSRTVRVSERGMSYDRKRKMGCWAY